MGVSCTKTENSPQNGRLCFNMPVVFWGFECFAALGWLVVCFCVFCGFNGSVELMPGPISVRKYLRFTVRGGVCFSRKVLRMLKPPQTPPLDSLLMIEGVLSGPRSDQTLLAPQFPDTPSAKRLVFTYQGLAFLTQALRNKHRLRVGFWRWKDDPEVLFTLWIQLEWYSWPIPSEKCFQKRNFKRRLDSLEFVI